MAPTSTNTDPVVLVSADTHVGPRLVEDLRPYCERKYLDAFDAWTKDVNDGITRIYDMVDEDFLGALAWNARTEGHYDVYARLRDMDIDGVVCEVVFHGSQNLEPMPFESANFFGSAMTPPDQRELVAAGKRIYNRWLADFCSVEPARHVGLAQVPMWDIDASIEEVQWAAEAGLRGVNFPAADSPGVARLDAPEFDRFFSVCEDLGMPLVTHMSPRSPHDRYADAPGFGREMAFLDARWWAMRSVWIMTCAGVFERHPRLKLVLTEVPGNWFARSVADCDSLYDVPLGVLRAHLPRRPREYIARNVWLGASFPSPLEAQEAVDEGYADHVMWGTDYPHVEGTWSYQPDDSVTSMTRLALARTYAGLPYDAVRKMVGLNAIECYDLDGAELERIARRIGAPTLDELLARTPEAVPHPTARFSMAFRTRAAWS